MTVTFSGENVTVRARSNDQGTFPNARVGDGAMPTQELARRLGSRVVGVHTDARSNEDGFGRLKVWMQRGSLRLPRYPALLQQLSAREFTERDSGSVHIAVPDRAGHDDLVMALCLAAGVAPDRQPHPPSGWTAAGLSIVGPNVLGIGGELRPLVRGSLQERFGGLRRRRRPTRTITIRIHGVKPFRRERFMVPEGMHASPL